ncbi:MAG: pitrilysin family protein [Byssovorax sp.]
MRARVLSSGLIAASLAGLAGCTFTDYPTQPELAGVVIPIRDTTPKPKGPPPKEQPPASGPARDYRFPAVAWSELPTGLKVGTIPSKALPIVQIRVVVLGGKSADGERPGLTAITAQLLEDGGAGSMSSRDLVTKIESMGGNLTIDTGFDSTVLSLAVTKDHLDEALDLLGAVVGKPRLDSGELDKLKKREIDRTSDAARTSGRWGASMVLYRDLFALPSEHHPYATYDATADEYAKISIADCRAQHRKLFVPKNTFVVVAGDTTPESVNAAVKKAFSGYQGGEPQLPTFTDPNPPEELKITLVDRPKSSQSDIYAAVLGPERQSKAFASFAVANQVLGGGVAGRLFLDVRERQSLAYRTNSSVIELGHGPSLLVAYAGTQSAKTGLAVKGVLDNLEKIGTTTADDSEIHTATAYLSDVFAIKLETIGAVADELVRLRTLGLPDDYDDGYRKEVRDVTPALALNAASGAIRPGHLVLVVAGDAATIGPMLSHFGQVKVVDPTRDFARIKTLPMDADAPLEAPRKEGQ